MRQRLLLILSLAALCWLPLQAQAGTPRQIPESPPPQVEGLPAPGLTLQSSTGETFNPSQPGGPTVLYFWARWCRTCMQALPQVQLLANAEQAEQSPVSFLTVNVDRDPEVAQAIVARLKSFTLPIVLDSRFDLAGALDLQAMPVFVILDDAGIVQKKIVGYRGVETDKALQEALDAVR